MSKDQLKWTTAMCIALLKLMVHHGVMTIRGRDLGKAWASVNDDFYMQDCMASLQQHKVFHNICLHMPNA